LQISLFVSLICIFVCANIIFSEMLIIQTGDLPPKQKTLVLAWITIHEEELYKAWNSAVREIEFGKIEPLR